MYNLIIGDFGMASKIPYRVILYFQIESTSLGASYLKSNCII